MAPKRVLTQEEIQEIKALRGKAPVSRVKKQFGVGAARVQMLWAEEETPNAATEEETPNAATEKAEREESVVDDLRLLLRDSIGQAKSANGPTINEFYELLKKSLSRFETTTEKVSISLTEIIASLKRREAASGGNVISENIGKSIGTFYTLLYDNLKSLESLTEQAADVLVGVSSAIDGYEVEPPNPSVVEKLVDMAERWVYLSLSIAIVCGVFATPATTDPPEPRDTAGESSETKDH